MEDAAYVCQINHIALLFVICHCIHCPFLSTLGIGSPPCQLMLIVKSLSNKLHPLLCRPSSSPSIVIVVIVHRRHRPSLSCPLCCLIVIIHHCHPWLREPADKLPPLPLSSICCHRHFVRYVALEKENSDCCKAALLLCGKGEKQPSSSSQCIILSQLPAHPKKRRTKKFFGHNIVCPSL